MGAMLRHARRTTARLIVLALVVAVLPAVLAPSPARADYRDGTLFHGAIVGGGVYQDSTLISSRNTLSLGAAGTIRGGWLYWSSASSTRTSVTLDPGTSGDTSDDVTIANDGAVVPTVGGDRYVFGAQLPLNMNPAATYTVDGLSGNDVAVIVAVVEAGTGTRTFVALSNRFRTVTPSPNVVNGSSAVNHVSLPRKTTTAVNLHYGVIESWGSTPNRMDAYTPWTETTVTKSVALPSAFSVDTLPAGTEGAFAAGTTSVTETNGIASDADTIAFVGTGSLTQLYSGVSYAAPAPAISGSIRYVQDDTDTTVTSAGPGDPIDMLVTFTQADGPVFDASATVPLPAGVIPQGSPTIETGAGTITGDGSSTDPYVIRPGNTDHEMYGGTTIVARFPFIASAYSDGTTSELSTSGTLSWFDRSEWQSDTGTIPATPLDILGPELTLTVTPVASPVELAGQSQQIQYRVTLTNNGPGPITAGTLAFTSPPGAIFTSHAPSQSCHPDSASECSADPDLVCTATSCTLVPNMAEGDTYVDVVTYTVPASACGDQTLTVSADGFSPVPATATPLTASGTVTATCLTANVGLSASPNKTVTVDGSGDPYSVSFTVKNNGPYSTHFSYLVIDVPDSDDTLLSKPDYCNFDGALYCSLPDVPAGGSVVVTLKYDAHSTGTRPFESNYGDGEAPGTITGSPAPTTVTIVAPTLTLTNPGTQRGITGRAAALTLKAPGAVSWQASGLPPGLTINRTTGKITGTPIRRGNYDVLIRAANTWQRTTSGTFRWSVQDPSSLVRSGNAVIVDGASRTLAAQLSSTYTGGIPGAYLLLQRRPAGTSAWLNVHTYRTGSGGMVRVTVKPTTTTAYRWVYTATPTALIRSATSAALTVTVRQAVTVKALKKTVTARGRITLYGRVAPGTTGQVARVYEWYHGAWHATTVHARVVVQRLPDGVRAAGYKLSFSAGLGGKRVFRVYVAPTTRNAANYTASTTITVRRKT